MDDTTIKKHLDELNSALDCGNIDEVGITLDPSLPLVVQVENKLGLAKSFLKPMFKYALSELYLLRKEIHNYSYKEELKNISRAVLLVKGDFPVAYDVRKTLISTGAIEVKLEIPLTAVIFTLHPKCPSGWQHRRWCYNYKHKPDSIILNCSEIETEKELCREMAEKHPKNYYAWVHRLWLLKHMTHFQLEDELTFTLNWLQCHVSDHSAVNHRIQVLLHIFSSPSALSYVVNGDITESNDMIATVLGIELKLKLLGRVLQESEELVQSRPGHESLWALRRSLVEILLQLVDSTNSRKESILSVTGNVQVSPLFIDQLVPTGTSTGDGTLTKVANCENNKTMSSSKDSNTVYDDSGSVSMTLYSRLSSILTLYNHILSDDLPVEVQNSRFYAQSEELCSCLQEFLSYEMRLVALCCDEGSIKWDTAAQRQAALRYAAFLLHRLATYCKSTCSSGDNTADNSSNTAVTSGGIRDNTFYSAVQATLSRVGSELEANGGVTAGIAESFW